MFLFSSKVSFINVRHFCTYNTKPSFGLLIDIDGVIARVPTVFLTNSCNGLAKSRAMQLSEWLQFDISEEQVVMAYTPLKKFEEYFDKNTFFTGQGPVEEIARQIGFKKIVTVEKFRKTFPQLDVVDHERRKFEAGAIDQNFPKIEAMVLNGEPVRWETTLQLAIDLLITDGDVSHPLSDPIYPHIPILASNTDLQYMAEAHIPRFGHGAFLLCLESLYYKITGKELIYSVLVGKPSETTYWYAHQKILNQANDLNITDNIKCLYAIGDNVNADIFGANLFNQAIQNRKEVTNDNSCNICKCFSVLVKTGVYTEDLLNIEVNHVHRDFRYLQKKHLLPNYTVKDVSEAIELIFRLEKFKQIVHSAPS